MAIDLYQFSVETILAGQGEGGGYIACPNFPSYRYCWFRDGAYTAFAIDLAGHGESAARFHSWASQVILARAATVQRAINKAKNGMPLEASDILHTRYALGGNASEEDWPNFQLDGFGTWLWALSRYQHAHQAALPQAWLEAASLVSDYLGALWRLPCSDCWEEFPDKLHLYTLASIYAGLQAEMVINGSDHAAVLEEIHHTIFTRGVMGDSFTKFIGSNEVDASLVALCTPYRLVEPDHPIMAATVDKIEAQLRRGGGVHRYAGDTYYGGGEWILLTAWLGWYYAQVGQHSAAQAIRRWIEEVAGESGELPEQIPLTLNDPACYEPWHQRWGEIAKPLLWSHAKYIILRHALGG